MKAPFIDGYNSRRGQGWDGVVELEVGGPEGITYADGAGRIDGHAWRFHARWGLCVLQIAAPYECSDAAWVGRGVPGWEVAAQWNPEPSIVMDVETAWRWITSGFDQLRQGRLEQVAAERIASAAR